MLVYICLCWWGNIKLILKRLGMPLRFQLQWKIFLVLKNYDEYDNKYEIILAYGPAEFLKERCIRI